MKKQTAVQIIFEQFNLMSNATFKSWMLNNYDALETMEQEQIKSAHYHNRCIDSQTFDCAMKAFENAEQYYNETYG